MIYKNGHLSEKVSKVGLQSLLKKHPEGAFYYDTFAT